jgi:hypothetical protein
LILLEVIEIHKMRTEIKYLSIGLFIGLGATALLLTGMLVPPTLAASLPTDMPTLTSTPTSFLTQHPQPIQATHPSTFTYTPTPTLIRPTPSTTLTNKPTVTPTVPSPTPTLSGTMMNLLERGYLSQAGPLSLEQQFDVYSSSLKYVHSNTEESRLIGEQINGIGYGSPSNICGPLSIAILQDVGLIDSNLDPHTYWLLNADVWDDRRLLAKAFPPDQYENTRVKIKLNKVDWNETPLYPGDFLYIYAGYGGNFEHMLVVDRVDADGSAYAVTNHKTPNGFIISEVLLYNPADSNVGMFPVWTARANAETGSTGFAGFEVWRLRSP